MSSPLSRRALLKASGAATTLTPLRAGRDFATCGAHLAQTALLGNVAIRAGKKLEWDGENLKAKNCPEAARFIRRDYHEGWDFTS